MRTSRRPSPQPSSFAPDRGPAKYFHGRKQILRDFGKILGYSKQNKWGTTFLIQGAPGAGKTALLYKCGELVAELGWKTVEVNPRALWDSDELLHSLGLGKRPAVTEASAGVGAGSLVKAGVKSELPGRTTLEILRGGDEPLLLMLDEAQTLQKTVPPLPPDQYGIATGLLNAIHNGRLGRPVILIAAGLGPTTEAFRRLGISRFAGRARVELGALGKDAERAVLNDWLTEEGKATGDTTAWIDAIVQESHGWPQHILSYVDPALDQLEADKGGMTADGLATVLEAGRALRTAYYRGRVEDFDEEHLQSFAKVLVDVPLGGSTTRSAILPPLTQEYGLDEAKELFRRAEEKGIIDRRAGRYVVPIPSMHDWLVSNYARIQVKGISDRPLGQLRNVGGLDSVRGLER